MGKVNDFNTKGGKLTFKTHPCLRALPVGSDKHGVKMVFLPGLQFVFVLLRHDTVHIANRFDDGRPLFIGDDGRFVFLLLHQFIRAYTNDQIIALFLRPAKNVQVPDMKHIVDTCGVTYFGLLPFLLFP